MIFRRLLVERVSGLWMVLSLAFILVLPVLIGTGLYLKARPLFADHSLWQLVGSSHWQPNSGQFGFMPYIAGSLFVTLLSFLLSVPVCLLSAIFLTQFSTRRLTAFIHPVIDILAGLPSVIYGVWGILVIVPFISGVLAPWFKTESSGYCILAGGIVLAVMCIPYMLNMLIEIFKSVPDGLREASLSLGATLWETVRDVVIRKSTPGIISAFGLGIAKAFGETIAVMMVVGNMVQVAFNPLEAGYPLPALIANNYGEMLSVPHYDAALMFAALLLLVIIMVINLVFRYFIHKTRER